MEQKKSLTSDYLIKPLIKLVIALQLQILREILQLHLLHYTSLPGVSNQQNKNNKEQEFYTNEEVMELLRISRRTLYSYRKEGKIRSIKTENTIRFSKKDIDGFKEEREGSW